MNELQISLLALGVVVVLAVYAYSGWQQRQYRRKFGAVFQQANEDALYRSSPKEPNSKNLDAENLSDELQADGNISHVLSSDQSISTPQASHKSDNQSVLVDSSTDYVAVITTKGLAGADALTTLWQQRFDFGKSVHVYGLNVAGGEWEKVIPESRLPYAAFKLALQLVDRAGAVSEARLADFRDLARMIAVQLQADVVLPDVADAFVHALALDKFCASVDQMTGLNIFPRDGRVLSGSEVAHWTGQHGLSLQPDGLFHMHDAQGYTLFSLGNFDNTPFQHYSIEQHRVGGLTLLLDVPCVELPTLCFDQMVELAKQLAHDLAAEIKDDHHVALSEPGIALIREQISAIENKMLAGNVIPGSAQTRRLFS